MSLRDELCEHTAVGSWSRFLPLVFSFLSFCGFCQANHGSICDPEGNGEDSGGVWVRTFSKHACRACVNMPAQLHLCAHGLTRVLSCVFRETGWRSVEDLPSKPVGVARNFAQPPCGFSPSVSAQGHSSMVVTALLGDPVPLGSRQFCPCWCYWAA